MTNGSGGARQTPAIPRTRLIMAESGVSGDLTSACRFSSISECEKQESSCGGAGGWTACSPEHDHVAVLHIAAPDGPLVEENAISAPGAIVRIQRRLH